MNPTQATKLRFAAGCLVALMTTACTEVEFNNPAALDVIAATTTTPTSSTTTTTTESPSLAPTTRSIAPSNSTTLTVSGGTAPYTVASSSSAIATATISSTTVTVTGVAAGTATITVTDSKSKTGTATVTVNAALALSPTTSAPALGATATFTASGGVSPYTFTLPTAVGALSSGTTSTTYTRPWRSGSDTVRVTDSLSNTTTATVTLNAMSIQDGTAGAETVTSTFVDASGNIWVAGSTDNAVIGGNGGGTDGFFVKYSTLGVYASGATTAVQIGGVGNDVISCIRVTAAGDIYVAGTTDGNVDENNAGGTDIWVAMYNSSLTQQWITQLGDTTPAGGTNTGADTVTDCRVDGAGSFFVLGNTNNAISGSALVGTGDGFIQEFDGTGAVVDSNGGTAGNAYMIGSAGVVSTMNSLYIDASDNVYVGGVVNGTIDIDASGDVFDGSGDLYFLRLDSALATPLDRTLNNGGGTAAGTEAGGFVVADAAGNIYLAGQTNSANLTMAGGVITDAQVGGVDYVVAKWDNTGTPVAITIDGTAAGDEVVNFAATNGTKLAITGSTTDAFAGASNQGATDVFISQLDTSLNLEWVSQLGSTGSEAGVEAGFDTSGYAYFAGNTNALLTNSSQAAVADQQWFLAKYSSTGTQQ